MQHPIVCPRLVFSALRGGAGKSTVAIGVTAALKRLGKRVVSFKKGPDYIDAGWLSLAAGVSCRNLDTFFIPSEAVLSSFFTHTTGMEIAVIEGNRGLYDGIDIDGRTSTAEIAKLLGAPVVLCLDCTKTTRTSAAVVAGCMQFDEATRIRGVVLNRVAGPRHESIVRRSIEHYCGIPVVGAIPKLAQEDFPERHMGLVPTCEHAWAQEAVGAAARIAQQYIDLDAVAAIADHALPVESPAPAAAAAPLSGFRPVVAVARDAAFQFYYPDNLEALEQAGADLVFVSPLSDPSLPANIDALYLGGGFPETHAKELAANASFRQHVLELAEAGLPIYAECGGLMYLGKELDLEHTAYPMCNVLPVSFGISARPAGHGYTISMVDRENPWFSVGMEIRGHEFRYSTVRQWEGADADLVFSTTRGKGFVSHRDGICRNNVFAAYTHIHALGTPAWAPALVANAARFHSGRRP
ncbi:MAG: cobyrinate a,c-diamide synthase [Thermodesulfobacteriota bacterium]|nr:cobyrinate a,c-diamide synthase [Thermodesulfobacteriota bacterium]